MLAEHFLNRIGELLPWDVAARLAIPIAEERLAA